MPAKQIARCQEARELIRAGVQQLAKAVKVTLGPRGRNVIIGKSFGAPLVTKDGVSVAKEVDLEDNCENVGARMVREVSSQTSDAAGDGTTTATILAEAIFCDGLRAVAAGIEPLAFKRGVNRAVEAVVKDLHARSTAVTARGEIANVARIASNNDVEVGEMVADAMDKVGKDGVITVEEGKGLQTEVVLAEGMQLDKGYISPHFATDVTTREAVLEDACILICEKKVSTARDIMSVLEKAAQSGRPLLIIAEDVDGEALATMVINKLRGTLKCCAVKAPGFGDRRKALLEDIAIMTGGQAVFEALGIKLDSLELDQLGTARKIVVTKDTITIIEGGGAAKDVKARIAQIRAEIEDTTSDYDREKLEERLAKLSGGVAELQVGAATEVAMKEKKARVENALNATRAAVEEGIIPGGGVGLVRAAAALAKLRAPAAEKVGINVVRSALMRPIRQIADNAGFDGTVVASKVADGEEAFGFDAEAGEYGDMIKAGILDPTKVVRTALENAASVATLLLTTDTVVTDYEEENED